MIEVILHALLPVVVTPRLLGTPETKLHPDLRATWPTSSLPNRGSALSTAQGWTRPCARRVERLVAVLVLADACAAVDGAEHQASMTQLSAWATIIQAGDLVAL